jgi:hypothetical protein
MSWDDMTGNDRIRFCARCKLNVYNLTQMSEGDIETVIRETEGKLCARLYDRGDGTATAGDCPPGRARKLARRALAVGLVFMVAAFAWMIRVPGRTNRTQLPTPIREIVDWIAPEPPAVMGKMILPVPPKAPAADKTSSPGQENP